ncbi:hypothetical protein [Lacticaseibacillus porcinae]|uniref:hypothetical protein n=1 Tax=Lacticaseibacillus porcinae TaxID=1123687 RepID=UPI000F7A97F9|nr:hypothetical protein [Lacticaseibacillus porcinae]
MKVKKATSALLSLLSLSVIFLLIGCTSIQKQTDTDSSSSTSTSSTKKSSTKQTSSKKISPKQQLSKQLSEKYTFAYQFHTVYDDDFTFKDAVMLINPETHQLGLLFKAKHQLIETNYQINQTPTDTPEHDWNQFTYNGLLFDWKNQFDDDDNSIFIARDANSSSDFETARKTDIQSAVDYIYSD